MKPKFNVTNRVRSGTFLLLILALLFLVNLSANAAPTQFKRPNTDLLNVVRRAEIEGNWLTALMYLTAYIERDPVEMQNNKPYESYIMSEQQKLRDLLEYYIVRGQSYVAQEQQIDLCLYAEVRSEQAAPPQAPPLLGPSPDEALIFVHGDYGGVPAALPVGTYNNVGDIGFPNDSASSLRVGSNVRVWLCTDANLAGRCEPFTEDDPNLSDNAIGNDQVSSAVVQPNQRQSQQSFYKPMVDNYRLDWCYHFGNDCGLRAAIEWCKTQGFTGVSDIKDDPDVGNQGIQTKVLGTGDICNSWNCDSFESITCSK